MGLQKSFNRIVMETPVFSVTKALTVNTECTYSLLSPKIEMVKMSAGSEGKKM